MYGPVTRREAVHIHGEDEPCTKRCGAFGLDLSLNSYRERPWRRGQGARTFHAPPREDPPDIPVPLDPPEEGDR